MTDYMVKLNTKKRYIYIYIYKGNKGEGICLIQS